MALMNAFKQIKSEGREYIAYYLIAQRVYGKNDPPSPAWFTGWVNEVRSRIEDSDFYYMRTGKYDRFIGLLFPELARGLSTCFGVLSAKLRKADREESFTDEQMLAFKRWTSDDEYYAPVVDFERMRPANTP